MIMKFLKYFLVIVLVAGLVGGCGWVVSKWLLINKSAPETAMKVSGVIENYLK